MNRAATHAFIAPDLEGRPTGGTLYNAQLIAALRAQGVGCDHFTLADAGRVAQSAAASVWVDSLYLDALPGLRAGAGERALFLVLHYLPSLVAHGRTLAWSELSAVEQAALTAADGFLVPSEFMRAQLARFVAIGERSVVCVEPACELAPAARVSNATEATRAVVLCNVVAAKGVLPLLEALAHAARATDRFTLRIVGGTDVETDYTAECRRVIDSSAVLRERVVLCGALPHAEALACLADSDVLLSASRMEAYGMALAEARAAGVPIVARRGGNAEALVASDAGGTLVESEAELVAQFMALVRERAELSGRASAARAAAPAYARSWRSAALELQHAWQAHAQRARQPRPA